MSQPIVILFPVNQVLGEEVFKVFGMIADGQTHDTLHWGQVCVEVV